jgi:hypothetical protein
MPIDRLQLFSQLPCSSCIEPQGADTRIWLANACDEDLENQRSPGGLPLSCCRVHVVGGFVKDSDATPVPTR